MLLTTDGSWIALVLSTLFTFLLFVVGLFLLWRRTNRVRGLPQHPLTRQRSLILRTELPEVTTLVTQANGGYGVKGDLRGSRCRAGTKDLRVIPRGPAS